MTFFLFFKKRVDLDTKYTQFEFKFLLNKKKMNMKKKGKFMILAFIYTVNTTIIERN